MITRKGVVITYIEAHIPSGKHVPPLCTHSIVDAVGGRTQRIPRGAEQPATERPRPRSAHPHPRTPGRPHRHPPAERSDPARPAGRGLGVARRCPGRLSRPRPARGRLHGLRLDARGGCPPAAPVRQRTGPPAGPCRGRLSFPHQGLFHPSSANSGSHRFTADPLRLGVAQTPSVRLVAPLCGSSPLCVGSPL